MTTQILDRTQPPASEPVSNIGIPEIESKILGNGIPMYSISAGEQEVCKVELIFEIPHKVATLPIIPSLANSLLSAGTRTMTADEISEKIDNYGAFLHFENTNDHISVSLYSLNKYLEITLPILHDIITGAIFPQEEIEIYCQNKKQKLIVDQQKVSYLARQKFSEIIYGGNNYYGYFQKPEDYDGLTSAELTGFFQSSYQNGNCRIILAGKVHDQTYKLVENYFGQGNWGGGKAIEMERIDFEPSVEKKHTVIKDDAIQSAIRIGKVMFNRLHEDYMGMQVLNTVLGGYFGSRLMSNIREEKGYTYGIGSALVSFQHSGYFFITTEVGVSVCESAIAEIYKEVLRLKKEEVGGEELDLVKNYMLGSLMKSFDGAFAIADRFKSVVLFGLDMHYYNRYIDCIRNISAGTLLELANKYLDEASLYELVVGKRN